MVTIFGPNDELTDKLFSFPTEIPIFAEELDYDVEKDKSSKISLFPEGGKVLKVKERRLDKAIYEAFMMDLWKNVTNEYNKKFGINLDAPRFYKLGYDFENFKSYTLMEFCRGKPIKKIAKTNKQIVDFMGEKIRVSSLVMYHLGALQAVKRSENLVHTDYDQRHVLFFRDPVGEKNDSLSVIDVENSHLTKDYSELEAEEKSFKDLVFRMYSGAEEEALYHRGFGLINPLEISEGLIQKTLKDFNKKIWRNGGGGKVALVDPHNKSVNYQKRNELENEQLLLFKDLE